MGTNKEIEEMLSALGDPTPKDLKEEEDDPEVPEVPETSETPEIPEVPETPEVPEVPETPEVPEETDKDKIIESLRKRLNEKPEIVIPEKKEEKVEEKKPDPFILEDQDFIGDLDLEDTMRDKDALNKLLNAVYSKGVNDSKRVATESVLDSIPDMVKHNLTLLTSLKEASDNFYNDNKDLIPFKRVVAAVFEDIAANNPDKRYGELMNLVAPEARKRLELHIVKKTKEEEKEEERTPRLHGTKSGQRQSQSTKPNVSAIEKEISEMNKVIGGR